MTTDRQAHLSIRSLSGRLRIVAEATVLALVIWSVAALAGVGLYVQTGSSPQSYVGAAAVAVVATLAGLAGWALLALLERVVARPRTWWTAVAIVVLGISLLGPLADGVGAATTLTLLATHLGVGTVLITQLPGRS